MYVTFFVCTRTHTHMHTHTHTHTRTSGGEVYMVHTRWENMTVQECKGIYTHIYVCVFTRWEISPCVCLCVRACVHVREKERESERKREGKREREKERENATEGQIHLYSSVLQGV